MKLLDTRRHGANHFSLIVQLENGEKEKWFYERVATKIGAHFLQVRKDAA